MTREKVLIELKVAEDDVIIGAAPHQQSKAFFRWHDAWLEATLEVQSYERWVGKELWTSGWDYCPAFMKRCDAIIMLPLILLFSAALWKELASSSKSSAYSSNLLSSLKNVMIHTKALEKPTGIIWIWSIAGCLIWKCCINSVMSMSGPFIFFFFFFFFLILTGLKWLFSLHFSILSLLKSHFDWTSALSKFD